MRAKLRSDRKWRYVYRIERKGVGPWSSDTIGPSLISRVGGLPGRHRHPSDGPTPNGCEESGTPLSQHPFPWNCTDPHVFGFATLGQYRRWFNSQTLRDALSAHGGKLLKFRVDEEHVLHGNWQVAFLKDKAKLVATLTLAC